MHRLLLIFVLVGCNAEMQSVSPENDERSRVNTADVLAGIEQPSGLVVKPPPARKNEVILAGQRMVAPPGFQLELIQDPPLEKLSAISATARCDFGVLLGHNSDEDRAKLVQAMEQRYPGEKLAYVKEAKGVQLTGIEIAQHSVRLFSAQIGADLLAVSYSGPFGESDQCDPLLAKLVTVLSRQ